MIPKLETGRLILEKLSTAHLSADYISWMNDPEVYQYLETGGNYTSSDLENYLLAAETNEKLLFWAIKIKENGCHIGNIKIDPVNSRHQFAEYAIMMGDKQNWGKGFAQEASQIVIEYCFKEIGLRKVNLGVVADNLAAVELYKKLGFEIEGVYKYHGFYDGKFCDVLRMSIFNPEFVKEMDGFK